MRPGWGWPSPSSSPGFSSERSPRGDVVRALEEGSARLGDGRTGRLRLLAPAERGLRVGAEPPIERGAAAVVRGLVLRHTGGAPLGALEPDVEVVVVAPPGAKARHPGCLSARSLA